MAEQERIGKTLERLGMRMGVFVGARHRLERADADDSATARSAIRFSRRLRESVDVAKRVEREVDDGRAGPRRPAARHRLPDGQRGRDAASAASAILEPHGLVMVLEPLNTLREPSRACS